MEVRTGTLKAASPGQLTGYAAVFNSEARLGDFAEIVRRGAFADLSRNIKALYHHDSRALLGSTAAGTLKVQEDDHGLRFDLRLPDTSHGRDLAVLVERGDVAGCSFGFVVPEGGDRWEERNGGEWLRELLKVDLHEITLTADPAYPDTTVAKRSRPQIITLSTHALWLQTCA